MKLTHVRGKYMHIYVDAFYSIHSPLADFFGVTYCRYRLTSSFWACVVYRSMRKFSIAVRKRCLRSHTPLFPLSSRACSFSSQDIAMWSSSLTNTKHPYPFPIPPSPLFLSLFAVPPSLVTLNSLQYQSPPANDVHTFFTCPMGTLSSKPCSVSALLSCFTVNSSGSKSSILL